MVKTITAENFEQEVMQNEKTVVLDFWASWCGPCRMFAPTVEKFSEDNPDVFVGKVNIDEEETLRARFGVMQVPTLVIIKGGEVVKKHAGVIKQAEIESMI